ncbi:MAG: hypothetical protein GPI90_23935, partial [Microcystis aeruginosa K13-05]|nr:hypothetical protein [Microcystis aeruginosa K13-05]
MARVPVISKDGKPLMPTKPSRARRWITGIGVQSSLFTLWKAHLELPFKRVKERMDNRRLMRRGRRKRRINRQLSFNLRAHRQKRFSNRRTGKLAPSIRANRQLELRVVSELTKIYPITDIYFEYIKA